MRKWWCSHHDAEINNLRDNLCWDNEAPEHPERCVPVPMRLIPDNAELAAALATYEHERKELQRGPSTELQVIAELVRGTT